MRQRRWQELGGKGREYRADENLEKVKESGNGKAQRSSSNDMSVGRHYQKKTKWAKMSKAVNFENLLQRFKFLMLTVWLRIAIQANTSLWTMN